MVTEMLQNLSRESVYEITHWFEKRCKGECRAPEAWRVLLTSGISQKTRRPMWKKAHADSAQSHCWAFFPKWYTSVLVGLLHEEKEPIERGGMHMH